MIKWLVYYFCKTTVNVVTRLTYQFRMYGKEHLPKGAAILAPNHASHLDPMLLGAFLPNDLHFFARDTLFQGFLGWLLIQLQSHPIQREGADVASMRKIINFLGSGRKIMLFPEGTRTRDGQLQEGKPGVALLAQRADVPIVPVYIHGTFSLMPAGKKPKLLGHSGAIIGEPIHPRDYAHLPRKEAHLAMTRDTMTAIAALKEKYKTLRRCAA